MQQSDTHSYTWPYPLPQILLAYANRYPNPLSRHIHTQDILDCHYDDTNNTLHTTKLVLKSGKLPRWAPKGIIARAETWVIEESVVDVLKGTASYRTRNVDHVNVLQVEEIMRFSCLSASETLSEVSAATTSSLGENFAFGSYLSHRIAKYGISSFVRNLDRSRSSLSLTLSFLSHPQYRNTLLHPHPDQPAYDTLPDPTSQASLFTRTTLASGFQHWELIGQGFSGHGLVSTHDVLAEPHYPSSLYGGKFVVPQTGFWASMREKRQRPMFLEPGNWAFWMSRWRPGMSLQLFGDEILPQKIDPSTQERRHSWFQRTKARTRAMLERNGWIRKQEKEIEK